LQVRFALLNVNTIAMSLNFFLILIPIYSYSLFLPSIIKGFGYTAIKAQLFTVPPNFLAFLSVIAFAWTSDKIKMRGPLILAGLTLAAVGYIMQIASSSYGVKYAGTFFVAVGAFPCSPLVLAWLANNLSPHTTKATGLGFQVAVGNCGKQVLWTYNASTAVTHADMSGVYRSFRCDVDVPQHRCTQVHDRPRDQLGCDRLVIDHHRKQHLVCEIREQGKGAR
jgi:MFS family permease